MTSDSNKELTMDSSGFVLKDEPYPDTYFEFPVSAEYLRR